MGDYDKKVKESEKRNSKFLSEFEKWLKENKLGDKTIRKHVSNADLYINDYLNYYDFTPAEEGPIEIYGFLNDWFIRKCLWSSVSSLKETASSVKKFYQFMNEKEYIPTEDYTELCKTIKENMDDFIDTMQRYDNFDEDDFNTDEFLF